MSVPESVHEEEEEDVEEEDTFGLQYRSKGDVSLQTSMAASIPERLSDYHRDRQPSRASIRPISATSVAESVHSEHPPSRLGLRQQVRLGTWIFGAVM